MQGLSQSRTQPRGAHSHTLSGTVLMLGADGACVLCTVGTLAHCMATRRCCVPHYLSRCQSTWTISRQRQRLSCRGLTLCSAAWVLHARQVASGQPESVLLELTTRLSAGRRRLPVLQWSLSRSPAPTPCRLVFCAAQTAGSPEQFVKVDLEYVKYTAEAAKVGWLLCRHHAHNYEMKKTQPDLSES